MKKFIFLGAFLILVFNMTTYASGEFSKDPNDFNSITNTIWEFSYLLSNEKLVYVSFYNRYYQDGNITESPNPNSNDNLKLISWGISPNLVDQPGMTEYGSDYKGEGTGYVCMLLSPSGYTDWFDIYQFSVDGNTATGTSFHTYGTIIGSTKFIKGVKIKDVEQDQNQPVEIDQNLPLYLDQNQYILLDQNQPIGIDQNQPIDIVSPTNNPSSDGSGGGGCFISIFK